MKHNNNFTAKIIQALLVCGLWGGIAADLIAQDATRDLQDAGKATKMSTDGAVWNLKDVDIMSVIGEVSKLTGKDFLIDPRVTGKISIVSHKPLHSDEVYEVFLSILQVLGYAAVESGEVVKIIPANGATQVATPVVDGVGQQSNSDVVVRIFELKNISADYVSSALRSYIGPQGTINSIPQTKILIVADYADNVARIAEIIERIDLPVQDQVEAIRLNEATASEVVNILTKLIDVRQNLSASQQLLLAADDHTNTVLISGNKDKIVQLRTLIAKLDARPSTINSNTEIIYLKYADAVNILPLLASIKQDYEARHIRLDSKNNAQSLPSNLFNSNTNQQTTQEPPSADLGSGSNSSAVTFIKRDDGDAKVQVAAPGVAADPSLNALILSGPPDLLRTYRTLIRKLDLRKQQVLVEVIIAEVEETFTRKIGVEWKTNSNPFVSFNPRGTNIGTDKSAPVSSDSTTGQTLLDTITGLAVGYFHNGSLSALVNLLASDNRNNIIATPNLVTLDNEWANIKVGSSIPVNTNVNFANNTSQQTFVWKDVATYLGIKPQISQKENIILTVNQASLDFADPTAKTSTDLATHPPTLTQKNFDTRVLLKNQEILVLAGLHQNQINKIVDKIPLLGDIPLVGYLFKQETKTNVKTNLMVFIKPTIISNSEDSIDITRSKYDIMRDRQVLVAQSIRDPFEANDPSEYLPSYDNSAPQLDLPVPFEGI